MPKVLRVYALGLEHEFVVVDECISAEMTTEFQKRLTGLAQGYTRLTGTGGWKGKEEAITIYRVASLTDDDVEGLITFLLENTAMKDLYVLSPHGVAKGYCYEEAREPRPQPTLSRHGMPQYHGVRDTGWPRSADDVRHRFGRANLDVR